MKWMTIIICVVLMLIPIAAQQDVFPDSDRFIVKVEISPAEVTLQPGETAHFSFKGFDAQGYEIPVAFSWSFTGGQLRQDGTYTAGDVPGDFELKAEISTGIFGIAKIKILDVGGANSQKVAKVLVVPASITLKVGEKQKFEFMAQNGAGKKVSCAFRVSYSGGVLENHEGTNYYYTAGARPGQYQIRIQTAEGYTATADITIVPTDANVPTSPTATSPNKPATSPSDSSTLSHEQPTVSAPKDAVPARIEVTPASKVLMPGQTCQFQFAIYNQKGDLIPGAMRVFASGGLVDDHGVYTAGKQPGKYTLAAWIENAGKERIVGRAEIEIVADASKIAAGTTANTEPKDVPVAPTTPAQPVIKPPENQPVQPTQPVVKPPEAEFDPEARPSPSMKYTILPERRQINKGRKCSFALVNESRRKVDFPVIWTCYGGGEIDPHGIFKAMDEAGQYIITACFGEQVLAKTTVAVITEGSRPSLWLDISPIQVKLKPGATQKFEYTITTATGKFATASMEWNAEGGSFDPQTSTYTAGDVPGEYFVEIYSTDEPDHVRIRASIVIEP